MPQIFEKDTAKRQFCTFSLEDQLFGVDILYVKEINATIEFTPIFHAPKEIKGYVNIRGQIHLILDLRLLLGYEFREPDEASRLVLFKPKVGENFGILVDRIGDVITVDGDQIEKFSKGEYNKASETPNLNDPGIGVCKLENKLIIILDAKKFLKAIEKQ